MKHTDSQRQRLKDYLDTGQSINPLQAYQQIGTLRLAARISDLIDEGYPISKEWVTVQNRFGEDVRVMKYFKYNGYRYGKCAHRIRTDNETSG